ncbi:MAG: T9SS type B sorting domain-containing protein, partial [Bacteroidota bacterium]
QQDTVVRESYTTGSGCDSLVTYEITVAFGTQPMISGPTRICAGETASLEVDGNFARYAWSTGNDGDDAPVTEAGTYTLTLTDITGCTLELSHELTVTELTISDVALTPPACPGGTSGNINLSVSGDQDLLYSIDGGESFQMDRDFNNLAAGDYTLVVENAEGCTVTSTATLTDAPALNLTMSLPPSSTIERGDSLPISLATDFEVAEWKWNGRAFLSCTDCPAPIAFPTVDTKFRVEAIALGGCSVVDSIMVLVNDNRRFYAPTAFSPNGDDQNDRWRVFTGPRTEAISNLQIADRWGGIRFQQAAAELPPDQVSWDGTQAGQPAPIGNYFYSATLRYTDGSSQLIKGQITLMR